jgi:hypothetical protein
MLLVVLPTFSLDTNPYFGFKVQDKAADYQQYVGEKVRFRQAITPEESVYYKSDRVLNQIGKEYIITKIMHSVFDYGIDNAEITIFMVSPDKTEKIKVVAYEKRVFGLWSGKEKPTIENIPLYFVEPFDAYKKSKVGKTLRHPRVKDTYTIVDIIIGKSELGSANVKTFIYILRNDRTLQQQQYDVLGYELGCFFEALSGHYVSSLKQVEKPDNPEIRYGKTQIIDETSKNNFVAKYWYEDNILSIVILGDSKGFSFELKNISDNSFKVIWNEAAFIDMEGNTSKIMHKGIKYSQREGDQPATTIIKDAKIQDMIYPIDNVYYDEDGKEWGVKSIYHKIDWLMEGVLGNQPDPTSYEGVVKLMLPIQIKDVVNEYIFVFDIKYVYDHPEVINLD